MNIHTRGLGTTLIALLFTPLLISAGFARLGENEAMAIKRYTDTVQLEDPERLIREPLQKQIVYRKDDYLVNTFYLNFKIVWLTIQREPARRLEPVEIATLMEANKGESTWIPDGRGNYIRKDGKAYGRIDHTPYQGQNIPTAVSIFSLEVFDRNGDIRPEFKQRFPSHINVETLRDF